MTPKEVKQGIDRFITLGQKIADDQHYDNHRIFVMLNQCIIEAQNESYNAQNLFGTAYVYSIAYSLRIGNGNFVKSLKFTNVDIHGRLHRNVRDIIQVCSLNSLSYLTSDQQSQVRRKISDNSFFYARVNHRVESLTNSIVAKMIRHLLYSYDVVSGNDTCNYRVHISLQNPLQRAVIKRAFNYSLQEDLQMIRKHPELDRYRQSRRVVFLMNNQVADQLNYLRLIADRDEDVFSNVMKNWLNHVGIPSQDHKLSNVAKSLLRKVGRDKLQWQRLRTRVRQHR